jgi:hypothetical protein
MESAMPGVMVGMFWGGMLMALPPIALGIGLVVFIRRQQRADAAMRAEQRRD